MIISAYGLILTLISNQSVLIVNIFYSHFEIVTVSFLGLSSYVLLGIYSSAISVSEDSRSRQSIRQFVISEPKLVDSIGTVKSLREGPVETILLLYR
jgi:hypothetical protein